MYPFITKGVSSGLIFEQTLKIKKIIFFKNLANSTTLGYFSKSIMRKHS